MTYTATDSHGAATSKTFTIAVSNPTNLPPVYNGGIPAEVDLFAPKGGTDSYTFPATAFSSPAGEALTYTALKSDGTALPARLTFDGPSRTFTAHPGLADLQLTVTLKATDTQGRSVSDTFNFYLDGTNINTNAMPAGGTLATQTASTDTATGPDGAQATTQATTQSTTTPNIQSYWFTYDADNRVDIDGGDLVSGQIQVVARTGSVEKEYNQAGEVVTELSNGGPGYGTQTQTFSYDARGNQVSSTLVGGQVETKQYDADGRLVADVYTYAPGSYVVVSNADVSNFHMQIGGWLSMATTYYYNAEGEVYATFDYGRQNVNWNGIWNKIDNGTLDPSTELVIPASPPSLSDAANGAAYGVLGMQSHVSHWDPNTGTGGYDAEGNALVYAYSFFNPTSLQWHTTTYRVSYLKQDGYLEKTTSGTSDDPSVLATTDTSLYDAFGRRIAIDTNSAGQTTDQVRAFAYDAEGEILQRRDGSATGSTFTVTANGGYSTEHYAYVQGQQVGNVDEHGTINVLGGVTGFSNSEAGTTNYVAQDGDTMQSIAQAIYGDGSLWYVVADANGFESPTDAAPAGQTLKLPQVTTNSNTAETFKPYNPHEISGSTTPSLSQAPQPPPSNHGCNALAAIIVIAVAVVVSFATYHTLDGSISSWAAGAIAGAAGSAASQVAGDALGTQHGFDWGQVLTGAVGGAIGGAVASKLAGANAFARGATEGAASYVGTYEADKLVGEPAHFSWAGLVANAVGSGAAAEIGPTAAERQAGMTNGTLAEKIEANVVQDVVTREVSVGLGDNHVQGWQQIGEDIFGNALGNAAVGAIREANARNEQHQQSQVSSSPLAPNNPNSVVDPVAAFLSGPYANTGNDAEALGGYNPLSGPLLASADGYSTYTGAYGLPSGADGGSSDYLALSGGSQKDKDTAQLYSWVAEEQARGAPPIGIANPTQQDLMDYVKEYLHVGDLPTGAPTLATITVTPSVGQPGDTTAGETLNDFGPTAANWINNLYGLSSPVSAPGSENAGFLSSAATGLEWAGTGAAGAALLGGALGKPWALSWGDSSVSSSILLQNRGKAPQWLANPEYTWSVATDGRNAAVDLRFLGRVTPWLEGAGTTLGGISVIAEGVHGYVNHSSAEMGHAAADGGVWTVATAVSVFGTPLAGFAVGLLWTGTDMLAQDYTYQGQNGWTAVGASLRNKIGPIWHDVWNAQEKMQQQDPQFYRQLWAQSKE